MRIASIGDQFFNGESARRLRTLWQNSHLPCHFNGGETGNGLAVEDDLTALQRHGARQSLQQRRLAAAIGPDDGRDLSARNAHAQRWDAYAAAGGAPAAGASGFGQQAASGFGQPGQQPGQQSGTPDQSGAQPASQPGPFGSAPEQPGSQPGSNRPDAGPSGEGGYGFDPGNK